EGWNLVGNPFPASLAANDNADADNNFLKDNATALDDSYEAIYYWDSNDYISINQASAASYISPIQGFFVKAATNGAQLEFNTEIQKHGSATFYKSGSNISRFTIGITGPENDYNETMIAFIDGKSKGLDPGYDSRKLKANPNISLYSILVDDDGGDYVIQSLPYYADNQTVKLGLDAWETGIYQFGNINSENLLNQNVFLEDKTENTFVNLSINPQYSFLISLPGSYKDRFVLHFGSIITDAGELKKPGKEITVFSDGNEIFIQNAGNNNYFGDVVIFNLAGQKLSSLKVSIFAGSSLSFPANLSAGLYLLHFISDEISITEKIILK
ncbi:MAG: T9SS type A sorting domain-containing protein, partial [Bacteroidota bacterium]|nr:T9SS type A sorting domain-containing protein [Bacteroidota bacterium]